MSQQKKKKKKSGVPDRWLDYRPVGRRIPGTRFIAFKVPLSPSLNCRVSRSDSFGLWDLLDSVEAQEQELGLIIDLTATGRYYSLSHVPQSCSYVKILTVGRHIPSDGVILSFKRAVRSFLNQNGDNERLIGVHCTHGLNRTGYLVCRYLIDVESLDPCTALELFNSCRGHSIERQNYLHDLQSAARRSNAGMDDPQEEPAKGLATRPPGTSTGGPPLDRWILSEGQEDGQTDEPTGTEQPKEKKTVANNCKQRPEGRRRRRRSCARPPQAAALPTYRWSAAQQTEVPPPV